MYKTFTDMDSIISRVNELLIYTGIIENIDFYNANAHYEKRILFMPFANWDEFDEYIALDEDKKPLFTSMGGRVYLFHDFQANIDSLEELGLIWKIESNLHTFMPEKEKYDDGDFIIKAVLHELGHWDDFCKKNKNPYSFLDEADSIMCEIRAEQFAFRHMNAFFSN